MANYFVRDDDGNSYPGPRGDYRKYKRHMRTREDSNRKPHQRCLTCNSDNLYEDKDARFITCLDCGDGWEI